MYAHGLKRRQEEEEEEEEEGRGGGGGRGDERLGEGGILHVYINDMMT